MKEVIEGWIARDQYKENDSDLYVGKFKPQRHESPLGLGMWYEYGDYMQLPCEMFPEIKWEDEPQKVKITIEVIDV